MGSFFKQIYRYTHPRSYRHNENLWPYMKIGRARSGEINKLEYRGQSVPIADLSSLKGKFSGPVMLTATGPSVKEIDFTQPPLPVPAFGVNGSWSLSQFFEFSFYVIVDMGFFDKKPEIVANIVAARGLTLFTTAHGIARIVDRFGLKSIQCTLALIEDAACKIYQPALKPHELKDFYIKDNSVAFTQTRADIGFSTDIRQGIFDAGTVIYWALQISVYLGFTELLIAGLDMNNFDKPRFYENQSEKQPTNLKGIFTSLVLPAFEHASLLLKDKKIRVVNLSVNSAIPDYIFEKVSYNDAFFKKN